MPASQLCTSLRWSVVRYLSLWNVSKCELSAVFFQMPLDGSLVPLSSESDLTAMMLNLSFLLLNGSCANKASVAVCASLIDEKTEPQVLREDHVVLKLLGEVPYQRETSFIIDGNSNAKHLTVGEAYVTEGNWAGFPPHKHDEDNMPKECIAEEIYYFLFDPKQGFAVQCLYTGDGKLDEAYRVKNDELVEFPYGYHTTVATPGYQTYFLWLMAGDHQGFNRSSDPDHAWIENK